MNIVVLDSHTLLQSDLSFAELKKLGNLKTYDRSSPSEALERAKDAEALFTNKVLLLKDELNALPKLKYIGVLATGYNVVDIEECKKRNITVTNIPAYGTPSVAQSAWAHILNIASNVAENSRSVHSGDWVKCPDFSYTLGKITEVSGLTLGIVGFGQIGKAIAKIADAFGMKVIANSPSKPAGTKLGNVDFISLEDLLKNSDVISLNCPLSDATKNIINEKSLALMKNSAWLINVSRGLLVDENALAYALNRGDIAAAGLDVLSTEPPKADNPLLSAKNCFITPHNAWASFAARKRLRDIAIANLEAWVKGNPINVVSK